MDVEAAILGEISETLREKHGLRVEKATPIRRGYLNEKWILRTNRGAWFAKSYHPERYRKHLETVWEEIDRALRLQMTYFRSGGDCPELLENGEGDGGYLHETPSGRKFVAMTCVPGDNPVPGTVSEEQLYSLGAAAAGMHRVWNDAPDGKVDGGDAPAETPLWTPDLAGLEETWQETWEKNGSSSAETKESLLLQRDVLKRVDTGFLREHATGWAHLDLWTENVMFEGDRLTAIIDFDRVRYSYPVLDLGRVVLSCTLHGGVFRRDAVRAFAEGYRKIRALPANALLNAVRHCWLIESFWWIRPPAASWSTAPRRFQQEMVWTAAGWDRLEEQLGNV